MKKSFIVLFVVVMLLSSFAPSTAYARVHHDFLNAYGLPPETSRLEFYDYVLENATIRPWEAELGSTATKGEVLDNYFFYGFEAIYPSDLGIEADEEYADWPVTFYMPDPPKATTRLIDTSEINKASTKLGLWGIAHFATGGLSTLAKVSISVAKELFIPWEIVYSPKADPADPLDEQVPIPTATTETEPASAPAATAEPAPKPDDDKMTDVRKMQEEMKSRAPTPPPIEVIFGEPGSGTGNGFVARAPVIHLYPEKAMLLNVEIKTEGEITKSIPDYGNGWTVWVEPSGIIDGKYEYLYYELFLNYDFTTEVGWLIDRSNFASEMRVILKDLGLRGNEVDEFIEYWERYLSKDQDYYAAYYLLPNEIEEAIELCFSKEPDSLLRVFFIFKPLENPIHIKNPTITPFLREGFTAVEWGGILRE